MVRKSRTVLINTVLLRRVFLRNSMVNCCLPTKMSLQQARLWHIGFRLEWRGPYCNSNSICPRRSCCNVSMCSQNWWNFQQRVLTVLYCFNSAFKRSEPIIHTNLLNVKRLSQLQTCLAVLD